MSARVLIVIPARFASTRFPGKPLVSVAGISLIERVYRLCREVDPDLEILVATDDRRIERHVLDFGGEARMTRRDHPSGTDRVAEVVRSSRCSIVINVQGDEPLLEPRAIRRLITVMQHDRSILMATLAHPIRGWKEYIDPHAVKVVTNPHGDALYFSRSPIPYPRDTSRTKSPPAGALRHIGIYAYRRIFLLKYVRWPQSHLEKTEQLEQLRALERGVRIRVLKTSYSAIGVDVPEDIDRVERRLRRK